MKGNRFFGIISMKNLPIKALGLFAGAFGAFTVLNVSATKKNCENPDFLLILGTRVEVDKPSDILLMRITAAAEFLRQNPETKAICCGGVVLKDQIKSEALVIKEGLISYGIDESRILLEDKSHTTFQNFINAKKILREYGNPDTMKLAFLSSDTHLLRAGVIAKKSSVKATGIPASTPKKMYLPVLLREFTVFPLLYKEYSKERKNIK